MRLRVGLRPHHRYGQSTHNNDSFLPHAPLQLCSYWGYPYVLLFMIECITEQQSSSRSTECSYPFQLEIILQVFTQQLLLVTGTWREGTYINCGHYRRLDDIKMSDYITMYGVHSIWFSLFYGHHPPIMIKMKHSLHQPC